MNGRNRLQGVPLGTKHRSTSLRPRYHVESIHAPGKSTGVKREIVWRVMLMSDRFFFCPRVLGGFLEDACLNPTSREREAWCVSARVVATLSDTRPRGYLPHRGVICFYIYRQLFLARNNRSRSPRRSPTEGVGILTGNRAAEAKRGQSVHFFQPSCREEHRCLEHCCSARGIRTDETGVMRKLLGNVRRHIFMPCELLVACKTPCGTTVGVVFCRRAMHVLCPQIGCTDGSS